MYAKELDLIDAVPHSIRIKRTGLLGLLKKLVWEKHSIAIKMAILSLTLAIISGAIYYYNFFTINLYNVKMKKANVEVQLQRRNDLIPNIIYAVNEYMDYEKHVFTHAADVRAAVKSLEDSIKKQGIDTDTAVLSKFQAVAEAYPALKASETYKSLMGELSSTESMIADIRQEYNKDANFYNSRLNMFPGFLFNYIFRFKPMEVFESDAVAHSAPKISKTQ